MELFLILLSSHPSLKNDAIQVVNKIMEKIPRTDKEYTRAVEIGCKIAWAINNLN